MFRAVFSNFFRFSLLSSMKIYWFTIWLHDNSSPMGAAKHNRQSERSVDNFSYRISVPTFPGTSSTSESVCTHSFLSPMRSPSVPNSISSSVVVSSSESEKYFSISPAPLSVPTISSVPNRTSRTSPESFTICSNCPTASRKRVVISLFTSFGTINPRHSDEKLLCILARSFVVFVRNR